MCVLGENHARCKSLVSSLPLRGERAPTRHVPRERFRRHDRRREAVREAQEVSVVAVAGRRDEPQVRRGGARRREHAEDDEERGDQEQVRAQRRVAASGDEAAMARQARELGMHTKHDRDSTLAFHMGTPWNGNLGAKMKRLRQLRKEDPVLARGEAALLLPFRPIALIMAMCRTFGVHVHMAKAFAPIARQVLGAEGGEVEVVRGQWNTRAAKEGNSERGSMLHNWRLVTTWVAVFLVALAAQVVVIHVRSS